MKITKTHLENCIIIEPTIFGDARGCFFESFNKIQFENLTNTIINFVQDNEAVSNRGVLRGLHFQKGEFAQAKLVRVIKGKVLDVAVDLRKDSDTYGDHFSIILSEENKKQLFVPRGFAHGYAVLKDNTIFQYKCDNYYSPDNEGGIRYDNEYLNIDWKLREEEIILSEKDKNLKKFKGF